jgi:hypothetical protein
LYDIHDIYDMEGLEKEKTLPKGIFLDENIKFGNSSCRFLGVQHRPETYEINENFFEESILGADVLVTELNPYNKKGGLNDSMVAFYKHITDVAKEGNIPIIIPDPEKDSVDALINRGVDLAGFVGTAGLAGYAIQQFNRGLQSNNREKRRQDSQEKLKMSRRNFLKGSVAATSASVLGANALASAYKEIGGMSEGDGVVDEIFQSSLDYRDVCIAKSIYDISDSYNNILVVYGAGHFPGVRKYLLNPELLEKKSNLYAHTFGLWSPDNPEEFGFAND